MTRKVKDLVGNTAMRKPHFNGQAGVPSHMLTLADIQELHEMQSSDMEGGKLNLKKMFRPIGKALKSKAGKKIIGSVIDAGLPVVNRGIATFTGTNEKDVARVTGVGRKLLKDKTGYGVIGEPGQLVAHTGVGVYAKTPRAKTPKVKATVATNDKRKRRGQIVSQLMKEQGMTLAEASKYIKANNIQY